MPKVTIRGQVQSAARSYADGDVVEMSVKDAQPLIECGAAEWYTEPVKRSAKKAVEE